MKDSFLSLSDRKESFMAVRSTQRPRRRPARLPAEKAAALDGLAATGAGLPAELDRGARPRPPEALAGWDLPPRGRSRRAGVVARAGAGPGAAKGRSPAAPSA